MSKGSPVIPCRFPADLLAQVDQTIRRSQDTRAGEPWNRTTFILQAVRDKLNHMERSRRPRKRPREHRS